MECNSENTSDANDVHLEGNFLFSLSFFDTRNSDDRNFRGCSTDNFLSPIFSPYL